MPTLAALVPFLAGALSLTSVQAISPPAGDASPPDGHARILAEELEHFAAPAGSVLHVIVRYRSQVGARLEVEGSEAIFTLPGENRFPALVDPKIRSGLLEVRARVTRDGAGPPVHVVESVTAAGTAESVLAAIEERIASTEAPRRRAIVRWALREAGGEAGPLLDRTIALWAGLAREELERGSDAALAWLECAHPALEGAPRWVEFANRIAERHAGDRALHARLGDLGLIDSSAGWRPRSAFLREVGMTMREGTMLTVERSRLLDEIALFRESGLQVDLLRGRTASQYASEAQAGNVVEGMKREEVVLARGYPERVTWVREGDAFYEAWFYAAGREVVLAEGMVFTSR